MFRGELSGLDSDGVSLPVAVKTLKEGASTRTERDFEREGRLLAELCHPNIVRLLGVVQRRTPRCLVFERMTGGDLHALLVARSPRGTGADGPPLTEAQLLHIAAQVADGGWPGWRWWVTDGYTFWCNANIKHHVLLVSLVS